MLDFLSGHLKITALYASNNWIENHRHKLSDIDYEAVSESEMRKISELSSPSEVLAIFELPDYQIDLSLSLNKLILLLDDIKDPGNLGTIIRTADWFGIEQIICSHETTDAFSPKVVQASMGSLARVNIGYTDLNELLSKTSAEIPVYGALLTGKPISEIGHTGAGIIIIGSEAHGINQTLFPFINQPVTIPSANTSPLGKAESLNASIATSIICYALTIPNHKK